jgi:hypothetical protein
VSVNAAGGVAFTPLAASRAALCSGFHFGPFLEDFPHEIQ